MDTAKEGPKSTASKKAVAVTPEATLLESVQRFQKAHVGYAQLQQEAHMSTQKHIEETYRNYASLMRTSSEEVQKNYEDAYRSLATAVQDAIGQDDAQNRIEDAYRGYGETMRGIAEDVQNRVTGAHRDYVSKMQEGQVANQKDNYDAYRNYLRTMQDAWSKLDVDAVVDAAAKGTLGHGA